MRSLTSDLLLTARDLCAGARDLIQALAILVIVRPESDRVQLAELSIGDRNVMLLRLRQMRVGPG
jgi:hypothetical protein